MDTDAKIAELQAKGYKLYTANTDGEMYDWATNHVLEGTYIGKDINQGRKKDQNIYHVKKKDTGEMVKFWGTTVLNDGMNNVPIGHVLYIVYSGLVPSQSGGNSYHKFDVLAQAPGSYGTA